MARITPIRISKNDRKEYARLVRNARAKIRRTAKNHGIDLESEVNLPRNIEEFTTRKQFNEWKDEVKSFTSRYNLRYQFVTNPYGVTASKSELLKMEGIRRREQAVARKEYDRIKDKQVHQGGRAFTTVEQRTLHMSKPDVTGITVPKDFDFSKLRSRRSFDEAIEVGERRQYPEYYDWRKEQMKMNFMKALEGSFHEDTDEMKELVDRLGDIPPDDFYDLYIQFEEFDFDSFDSDGQMVTAGQGQVEKMLGYLDKYDQGKVDTDFKKF